MRPPQSAAGHPGPEPPGRPPAAVGGRPQGTRGGLRGTPPPPQPSPSLSPPPSPWAAGGQPERQRPRTPPGGRLHPGGGRHSRGEPSRAPSAPDRPPAHSRIIRCRPGTEQRHPGMRKRSGPLWCQPGKGGGADRGEETSPPSPATMTHRRPTGLRLAPTTARQPRLNVYAPGRCAGEEGRRGRGPRATPQGRGAGNSGAAPPPLSPHTPPPARGQRGRRPSTRSGAEGTSPPPEKGP